MKFAAERRECRGQGKLETFNCLGFTHACDKTRQGKFTVLRRTMAQRLRAKLRNLKEELRRRLHVLVTEARMKRIADIWLPTPRIYQPYPERRLAVMIQGKNPVPQFRSQGSVRGAVGNRRPYRDHLSSRNPKWCRFN